MKRLIVSQKIFPNKRTPVVIFRCLCGASRLWDSFSPVSGSSGGSACAEARWKVHVLGVQQSDKSSVGTVRGAVMTMNQLHESHPRSAGDSLPSRTQQHLLTASTSFTPPVTVAVLVNKLLKSAGCKVVKSWLEIRGCRSSLDVIAWISWSQLVFMCIAIFSVVIWHESCVVWMNTALFWFILVKTWFGCRSLQNGGFCSSPKITSEWSVWSLVKFLFFIQHYLTGHIPYNLVLTLLFNKWIGACSCSSLQPL